MPRRRAVVLLGAAVLGLAAITAVLAAALLDGGSEDAPDRPSPNTAAEPSPTSAQAPTAPAVVQPEGVPDELWAGLEGLPDKLRNDLLQRFESGAMAASQVEEVIEQYADRNQGVRVGTVLEATDAMLRLEVYTTGEQAEVRLNEDTVLKRGNQDITAADLEPDELVMVLSRDGGVTAFAVTAFGVGAP